MPIRALIVGSDRYYCHMIREFLELRELITTIVLNPSEGIEKLFYEKPDLAVLEFISNELGPALINKINGSDWFQVLNFQNNQLPEGDKKPVLILEETAQINMLFDFLKTYLSEKEDVLTSSARDVAGNLEETFYPRLLAQLYKEKRTGILDINSSTSIKIYFSNGAAVFAEGGEIETALARMLLNRGRITKEDYEEAVGFSTENNQKIGETLVGMGLLSPHELSDLLRVQVEEKIRSSFKYTRGKYVFESGDSFRESIVSYRIDLPQVIFDCVRKFIDVTSLEEGNPEVEISSNLEKEINSLSLGPRELRFVRLLKDKATLEELTQLDKERSRLGRKQILKLLYFLWLVDLVNIPGKSSEEIGRKSLEKLAEESDETAIEEQDDIILLEEEVLDPGLKKVSEHGEKPWKDEILPKKPDDSLPGVELNPEPIPHSYSEIPLQKNGEYQFATETIEETTSSENVDIPSEISKPEPEELKSKTEKAVQKDMDKGDGDGKETIRAEISDLYSSLNKLDYYQILGISAESGTQEIRTSYFNLVKKFHPDANPNLEAEIRDKLEKIFSTITEAYQTLSDRRKKEKYDSRTDLDELKTQAKFIYEAEIAYKEGKIMLRQKRYQDGRKKFREAVNLKPDESAYLGALAWATFLGADDRNSVSDEIKQKLEEAISLNPQVAENYYYLGRIYKHDDNARKAEESFSKAVENDPDYLEAKRELRLVRSRKVEKAKVNEKMEKRFWSNFFRK